MNFLKFLKALIVRGGFGVIYYREELMLCNKEKNYTMEYLGSCWCGDFVKR